MTVGQEGTVSSMFEIPAAARAQGMPAGSRPVAMSPGDDVARAAAAAIAETPGAVPVASVDLGGLARRLRMAIGSFAAMTKRKLPADWDALTPFGRSLKNCQAAANFGMSLSLLLAVRDAVPVFAAAVDAEGRLLIGEAEYAPALLELRQAYAALLKAESVLVRQELEKNQTDRSDRSDRSDASR